MRVLSLFSGVGGFDIGLENAGMQTVFQCEWDKHCRTILDKHWPTVPKWDDVSTLTGKYILDHCEGVDVVAWGSPCQDLSVAGKRAGLTGGRSSLFHQGIRIIKELKELSHGQYPTFSIWENVAGALSSNNGADFGQILYEMDEAGACFSEWRLLDAQYFGVPQRRRRVFVISVFDSATASQCPNPLLPISKGLCGDTEASATPGKDPTDTTTASFGSSSFGGWTEQDQSTTLSTRDYKSANNIVVVEPYTSSSFAQYDQGVGTLRSNGGDLGGGSETLLLDGRRTNDVRIYSEPVQTLEARMGTGGNNVPMIAFSHTQGIDAQPSESAWPTLRKEGNGHAVAIPIDTRNALRDPEKYDEGVPSSRGEHLVTESTMAVRRLTPLECERLMGWPDNHTRYKADGTEQADTHRYKQCGNGVASPVAQWIGEQLLDIG